MGEIRVRVRLANALDEEMVRTGKLTPDRIRQLDIDAIVDTGATQSVVPASVLQTLGVSIRGKRSAGLADGRTEEVGISGPLLFDLLGRDTLEEALVLGDDLLIGQTVLEKMDLLADCKRNRLIPNPAHPNGPVSMVRRRT